MKVGLQASLAILTVIFLLIGRQSALARSPVDVSASEAAVRMADGDWAAAANVDSWMSFYAADAMVLLPNDQLARSKELVRQPVARLLALSHLSLTWQPVEVKVARSGALVFLIAAYELRFDDSNGTPVSDRGSRLEVWKTQADGSWKCIVDTWNLDASGAPPPDTRAASTKSSSGAPLVQAATPSPDAAQESGTAAPARASTTKYGDMPTNYEEAIRKYFLERLKNPESVQYHEISKPEQGYTTEITGGLLMREKRAYGWTVTTTINAKDSHNRYVGFKTYTFLFRGEKIVGARLPLPGDEMN
jgi:ketosteroid isomerase-like protein